MMTNVYFVHSHITLLSSLSIAHNKICEEHVFLVNHGYLVPKKIFNDGFQVISIPRHIQSLYIAPTNGSNNPVKDLALLFILDFFLLRKIKSKTFDLFIPHSRSLLFQFLLTNNRVNSLNYLDEGMLSYSGAFHKKSFASISILRKLIYCGRINYFRRCEIEFCCCFVFYQNQRYEKVIGNKYETIKWPIVNLTQAYDYSNGDVLVLDNYNLFFEEIGQSILELIARIARDNSGQCIHVKFHPRDRNRERISTFLKKKGIKFIEIPDHIILELAMLEGRISRVSGILSSLLFYSAAIGIPTISYINDFGSLNQAAKKWTNDVMPSAYYESDIYFHK